MVDDNDDERGRKRRLAPSSEHQLAAERQAQDYLEKMLEKADQALQQERERNATPQQFVLTPSQARHPNYHELHPAHERANLQAIVEHDRQELQLAERRQNLAKELPARENSAASQRDGAEKSQAREIRVQESGHEPERPRERDRSSATSRDAAREPEHAEDRGRQQDEQSKSADRQAMLREHGTEAPAEKAAEIKAEKLQIVQRRTLWGDEFKTTPEERTGVEKSQNMQQAKGLGRSR